MASPFIGEIRMVGFNFAPVSWAMCNGQVMPIAQNNALFALIGTTYGGDGVTTYALPNLQSRIPIHAGQGAGLSNHVLGELSGVETVTLTQNQFPAHNHALNAAVASANVNTSPANNMLGGGETDAYAASVTTPTALNPSAIAGSGGNQPHNNIQPYLTVTFVICLFGIFPSQN